MDSIFDNSSVLICYFGSWLTALSILRAVPVWNMRHVQAGHPAELLNHPPLNQSRPRAHRTSRPNRATGKKAFPMFAFQLPKISLAHRTPFLLDNRGFMRCDALKDFRKSYMWSPAMIERTSTEMSLSAPNLFTLKRFADNVVPISFQSIEFH